MCRTMKIAISPIFAIFCYLRCLSFIVKGITSTITNISWFFGSWITSSTPGSLFFSFLPFICIKTFSNNSVSFAPTTSIYINLNKTQKKELISFGISQYANISNTTYIPENIQEEEIFYGLLLLVHSFLHKPYCFPMGSYLVGIQYEVSHL